MTSKAQQTGMEGVYLVAAQLAGQGFIVSPTSRSARGADLLVTDQLCQMAFSVQVKTNAETFSYWLVGEHSRTLAASSHIYVLVNLHTKKNGTQFYIVPSEQLAPLVEEEIHAKSTWYFVSRKRVGQYQEIWAPFGSPQNSNRSPQGVA